MKDKSPWKSTAKIETVGVPAVGKFVEGTVATVYAVTDHTDLCKRLRDLEYLHTNAVCPELRLESARAIEALEADNAAIRELMNVYNLGGWTDAIAPMKRALAAEADNAALREQVEAFRREQIARSKIDPVTRLHNLCDHLADQRRESPFTAESLELADASYKELCADNAALRELLKDVTAEGVEHSTAKYTVVQLSHNLRAAIDAALLAGKEKP